MRPLTGFALVCAPLCGVAWLAAADQSALPSKTPPAAIVDDNFIRELQDEALLQLISGITAHKPQRRLRVIETVGDAKDHRAVEDLEHAYSVTTFDGVRCKLIESIGQLHDRAALGWLTQRLSDGSLSVQCFAAWAIGELHTAKAVPALLRSLRTPEVELRWTVLDALGKTGRNSLVAEALEPFLSDADVQTRFMAAQAMGGVAGPEETSVLLARLPQESSLDVQDALAAALGRSGGAVAVEHWIEVLKYAPTPTTEHWAEAGLAAAPSDLTRPALQALAMGNDARLKLIALRLLHERSESSRRVEP